MTWSDDDLDTFPDLICVDDSPTCTFDVAETAGECFARHTTEAVLCSRHQETHRYCRVCWDEDRVVVPVGLHILI